MTSQAEWLLDEIPGLERAGVLDAPNAERLRAHYAGQGPAPRSNRVAIIIAIIGGILIGGGVLLLIAHNWDDLPRLARVALGLLPLLAAQGLAWPVRGDRAEKHLAYSECVGAFWVLACGGAIAITAQVYHVSDDLRAFLQVWSLCALPVVWLLRSTMATVLYLGLVCGWSSIDMWYNGAPLFWLALLPVLPLQFRAWKQMDTSLRATWSVWAFIIALVVGTGFSLERSVPGLWILAYSGLFGTLLTLDDYRVSPVLAPTRRPAAVAGVAGMLMLALIFTYEWPWREIGWHYYRSWRAYANGPYMDLAIVLALCVPPVFQAIRCARQRRLLRVSYLIFPLFATAGFFLQSSRGMTLAPAVIFNAWLFVVGLATALTGARNGRLDLLNGGLLAVMSVVVARFFDEDMSLVVRGVVFIVLGAGLMVSNLYVVRRRRASA